MERIIALNFIVVDMIESRELVVCFCSFVYLKNW